jgi:hypothetical protein
MDASSGRASPLSDKRKTAGRCDSEQQSGQAISILQAHEPPMRLPAGDCFAASQLATTLGV